ncbi:hypothetical protein [Agreia bicolorata]|uniref:hypothetical protein n=1 Tax=Agreia bicolorata TaxID=110935 RepID=UPI00099A88E7|nr:hypothetical protein [Agreia bicolorata]
MQVHQARERFLVFDTGDGLAVDEYALDECLVDESAHFVASIAVESAGILKKRESRVEVRKCGRQVFANGIKALLYASTSNCS